MFRPDLVELVKQELIDTLPELKITIVRHTGSRWERYQQVELALESLRIFIFNEKGFYEATFESAADTGQISSESVLRWLGSDLPPITSRAAGEAVRALRHLLARHSEELIVLFSRDNYAAFKKALFESRVRWPAG